MSAILKLFGLRTLSHSKIIEDIQNLSVVAFSTYFNRNLNYLKIFINLFKKIIRHPLH